MQDLAVVKFALTDQSCSRAHHGSTVRDIGITTTDLTNRVEKRLIEIKFSILAPSGTKLKHKQTRVKKTLFLPYEFGIFDIFFYDLHRQVLG